MGAEDSQSCGEKCGYCGKDVSATLAAGESTCPYCGSDCDKAHEMSEKTEPFERVRTHSQQIAFWIALAVPSVLALLNAVAGNLLKGSDNDMVLGYLAAGIAPITSLYCGVWLACRIRVSFALKAILSLLFAAGIGFVNLGIVFVGCLAGSRHL